MIAMLRGLVADRDPDRAVIDVNGVGYLVHGPATTIAALPADQPVLLYVSTVVREDAITLFGFADRDGRDAFEILCGVNKVGPRLALAILSALPPGELTRAVEAEDIATLVKVQGIGKKTASRLCLELKGKLIATFQPTSSTMSAVAIRPAPRKATDPLALALAQLDYRKSDIDRALAEPSVGGPDDAPLEDRLRAALRVLGRVP